MCFQNSFKRIITFSAAFLIGIFVVSIYKTVDLNESKNTIVDKQLEESANQNKEKGTGSSSNGKSAFDRKVECLNFCRACKCEIDLSDERPKVSETENTDSANSKSLQITYKPKPQYSEEAKSNNVQGKVRVRVTFLANGEIGSVSEVAGLPYGLTEKAIEAAKQMRFEPQIQNNKPVTVTKVVNFSFTIY